MDEDKRTTEQLHGYPHLAKFWVYTRGGMANRFSHLAILNILYLQAELHSLEKDWKTQRSRDLSSGDPVRVGSDWSWVKLSKSKLNQDTRQWEIALKIREKLDEYYSAVLQYSQVAKLAQPTERERKRMCEILTSNSLDDGLGKFQSEDLQADENEPVVYSSSFADDLILLDSAETENDCLVRWVVDPLITLIHFFCKSRKKPIPRDLENAPVHGNETRLYCYPRKHLQNLSHVVEALSAAVMPLGSMVILYKTKDMDMKVVLVCVFTVLYCLAMTILSNARRIEVIAATAAFGSIQVVWISQNGAGGN